MKHRPEDCPYIVWIDTEETGNNIEVDQIIEVGAIITNRALEVISTFNAVCYAPPEKLAAMPEVVVKMHTENGLIQDVPNGMSLSAADHLLTMWKTQFEAKDHIPFAGSGIAHYDRPFINKDLPKFSKHITYWPYDVGVIRRSFKLWNLPVPDLPKEQKTHRALSDAYGHLKEYKAYRDMLVRWRSYAP